MITPSPPCSADQQMICIIMIEPTKAIRFNFDQETGVLRGLYTDHHPLLYLMQVIKLESILCPPLSNQQTLLYLICTTKTSLLANMATKAELQHRYRRK
jgi:hypothetical protein